MSKYSCRTVGHVALAEGLAGAGDSAEAAMEVRRTLSEEHDIEVVGPPPGQGAGA